jgi:hypothetical protein
VDTEVVSATLTVNAAGDIHLSQYEAPLATLLVALCLETSRLAGVLSLPYSTARTDYATKALIRTIELPATAA